MEQIKQEAKLCINDLQDIIKELLELIAPGKLYNPFFATLRELINSDNTIYDTEEFRVELRSRMDSFLKDVETEKKEGRLLFPL